MLIWTFALVIMIRLLDMCGSGSDLLLTRYNHNYGHPQVTMGHSLLQSIRAIWIFGPALLCIFMYADKRVICSSNGINIESMFKCSQI